MTWWEGYAQMTPCWVREEEARAAELHSTFRWGRLCHHCPGHLSICLLHVGIKDWGTRNVCGCPGP